MKARNMNDMCINNVFQELLFNYVFETDSKLFATFTGYLYSFTKRCKNSSSIKIL